MSPFHVVALPQAEEDVNKIVDWLVGRSPQGAAKWLKALEAAKDRLALNPLAFGLAPENDFVDPEIRQMIFKTKKGRRYRALYVVEENEVIILHVRGPGQKPLRPKDFREN